MHICVTRPQWVTNLLEANKITTCYEFLAKTLVHSIIYYECLPWNIHIRSDKHWLTRPSDQTRPQKQNLSELWFHIILRDFTETSFLLIDYHHVETSDDNVHWFSYKNCGQGLVLQIIPVTVFLKSLLLDGHFLTWFLIGWQHSCQSVSSHFTTQLEVTES